MSGLRADERRAALRGLSEALGFGEDPTPVVEDVRALYRSLDAEVTAASNGLELPCKPGCDACCHESVFLSAPEFLVVADALLSSWPDERLRRLVDRMVALAEEFEDELEMLETFDPGDERDEVAARIKFRCPLLSASGECTVYEARELNGRTFGQSWDGRRGEAYGCTLTQSRLQIIYDEPDGDFDPGRLVDARGARRRLANAVPRTETVHVYPWWFSKFAKWFRPHRDR